MDPDQIDSALDEANRLLEAGLPDESLQCLDEVEDQLVDSEDRIEWVSLRAYALAEMGRLEQALQTIEPLLEEYPESAQLFGVLGVILSSINNLELARTALETAVALDREDENLLANLALVYENLRDYRTAIRLYDQALALGADLDWALPRKAAVLTEAGDYAAAKATLKRYLSLVPEDTEQWIALAILHSDAEEVQEAYACYQQAEQLGLDSGSLRLNWGVTAVRAGHLRLATRQLERLQQIEPDSSRPALLRAFILEEQGDLREAQQCYNTVLARLSPENYGEMVYALEMAMDFHARRKMRSRCEELMKRAYSGDACTLDLCEPYRELTGRHVPHAYWFSTIVEADCRDDPRKIRTQSLEHRHPARRVQRNFQLIARDRDEAMQILHDFAERMGETHVIVREFVREEALTDVWTGIYEIDRNSLVLDTA